MYFDTLCHEAPGRMISIPLVCAELRASMRVLSKHSTTVSIGQSLLAVMDIWIHVAGDRPCIVCVSVRYGL